MNVNIGRILAWRTDQPYGLVGVAPARSGSAVGLPKVSFAVGLLVASLLLGSGILQTVPLCRSGNG